VSRQSGLLGSILLSCKFGPQLGDGRKHLHFFRLSAWALASGSRGSVPPLDFHIVDRSIRVLFFGLFCYFSFFFRRLPPGRGFIVLFFGHFFRYPSSWKIFCRRPWLSVGSGQYSTKRAAWFPWSVA